ncbi:hypothetical protein T492DRAFT_866526 [Pavlovales sp. CCMP2436]|nr:hypothetical protein T492DRAFT_866526 [Pavlovales sp. CCMP2436]
MLVEACAPVGIVAAPVVVTVRAVRPPLPGVTPGRVTPGAPFLPLSFALRSRMSSPLSDPLGVIGGGSDAGAEVVPHTLSAPVVRPVHTAALVNSLSGSLDYTAAQSSSYASLSVAPIALGVSAGSSAIGASFASSQLGLPLFGRSSSPSAPVESALRLSSTLDLPSLPATASPLPLAQALALALALAPASAPSFSLPPSASPIVAGGPSTPLLAAERVLLHEALVIDTSNSHASRNCALCTL